MTDLRVRRTQAMIQQAFISLVNQSGFQKVTVTQIAQAAMINRQTFYTHYVDKYQLADDMIADFIATYKHALAKRIQARSTHLKFEDAFYYFYPDIQKLLNAQGEKLKALMSIHTDSPSLEDQLKQVIVETLPELTTTDTLSDLEKVVISSLMIDILSYIIAKNQIPRLDELQNIIRDLNDIMS